MEIEEMMAFKAQVQLFVFLMELLSEGVRPQQVNLAHTG